MSIFTKIAAISTLVFSLGSASAIPVSVSQIWDPADQFLTTATGGNSSYSFTHSLLSGSGSVGGFFDPTSDTISSAKLSVRLYDSGGSESYEIYWDGILNIFGVGTNIPNPPRDYEFAVVNNGTGAFLSALEIDGIVNVKLTVTSGDLTFASSTLEAQVTKGAGQQVSANANAIPEPGSVALVGLGLLGLGALRRKQIKS